MNQRNPKDRTQDQGMNQRNPRNSKGRTHHDQGTN